MACVLCWAPCAFGESSGVDLGPIVSHDVDVNGNERWRILGPFIEKRTLADGEVLWAVRPFFSSIQHSAEYDRAYDVLWPVWFYRMRTNPVVYPAETGGRPSAESWWRFAGFTYFRDWNIEDPHSRYSLWVLPFYFQGRDEHGKPYAALFPVGGTIRDFLGKDESSFVLFPLTWYARINQVRTRAFLWPILSSTKGPGVERFAIFPFYGVSKRRTDYDKRFIMWPLLTWARYGEPGATGYGYVIFPLFGHVKLEDQESWLVLPPLFRFSKGPSLNQIYCPWPLFQKSSGIVDKLYIWPLWGRKTRGNRTTSFVLWPLYLTSRSYLMETRSHRVMVLPVVFLETKWRKTGDDAAKQQEIMVSRTFKLWPLLSCRREKDRFRFHFPSLWPFKDYEQIDRNYAPLWTLYSHSRCDAVSEDELLWGLFQYRRSVSGMMNISLFPLFSISRKELNKEYEWSFLKGLVGYERISERKKIRLLYIFTFGG